MAKVAETATRARVKGANRLWYSDLHWDSASRQNGAQAAMLAEKIEGGHTCDLIRISRLSATQISYNSTASAKRPPGVSCPGQSTTVRCPGHSSDTPAVSERWSSSKEPCWDEWDSCWCLLLGNLGVGHGTWRTAVRGRPDVGCGASHPPVNLGSLTPIAVYYNYC